MVLFALTDAVRADGYSFRRRLSGIGAIGSGGFGGESVSPYVFY